MKTFPIMLDVRGWRAIVVGGGSVGVRRARSLSAAGADVVLVAERVGDRAGLEAVTVIAEPYRPEHLAGARLVFACTDDRAVNARIAADARQAGALVNAADQPDDCDFLMPATLTDGDVILAVGTGGSAPALAGNLRDWLAPAMPAGAGDFAAAVAKLREELRSAEPDRHRRAEIMQAMCSSEMLAAFRAEGAAALERKLGELLAGE